MAKWKKILGAAAAVLVTPVVLLLAYASTRADAFHVERSQRIAATPVTVFALIEDFHAWPTWSPWEKLDPAMTRSFSSPARGVGATYAWAGNKEVGKGRMTITELAPGARLVQELEFTEPFQATNTVTFTTTRDGENGAKVTWSMDGRNNLMMKAFGLFMDMDKQIGADFEKGLGNLKRAAEKASVGALPRSLSGQARQTPS
jgi:uncharacterized protein YndB with AHSA1/START domain